MKIKYDPKGNTAHLWFKKGPTDIRTLTIAEDGTANPGRKETIVGIEIPDASTNLGFKRGKPEVELENFVTKHGRMTCWQWIVQFPYVDKTMRLYSHALTFRDAMKTLYRDSDTHIPTGSEAEELKSLIEKANELDFGVKPIKENTEGNGYRVQAAWIAIERICRRCEAERYLIWLRIWISISFILVLGGLYCTRSLFIIYNGLPDFMKEEGMLQSILALVTLFAGTLLAIFQLGQTVIRLFPRKEEAKKDNPTTESNSPTEEQE